MCFLRPEGIIGVTNTPILHTPIVTCLVEFSLAISRRIRTIATSRKSSNGTVLVHPIVALASSRRTKKTNNVLCPTVVLRSQTEIGVQYASVTATGGDLDTCLLISIGEEDSPSLLGKCTDCSIVVVLEERDYIIVRDRCFVFAYREGERTTTVHLLVGNSHMDNWDLVKDLDGNRGRHSGLGMVCSSLNEAAMNSKRIATFGHGNHKLSLSLAVVFEVIKRDEVWISPNSGCGPCTDTGNRSSL
mmetsp:Transcript_4998/g.11894  ORF Transcript_4998/g.11894 Transcript_4998/m.11894 type:complete len:245 (+) Transcript_4998:466-1200(+)